MAAGVERILGISISKMDETTLRAIVGIDVEKAWEGGG